MHALRAFSLALLASFTLLSPALAQQNDLNGMLARIKAVANGYPPRGDAAEVKETVELWHTVETGLLQYQASHPGENAGFELLLGDLYRMGHNLDIQGASDKAIQHLKKSIELQPGNPTPHSLLGAHFTYAGQPAEGEHELLLAYALQKEENRDGTLYAMVFNYYQQKKFAITKALADQFLAKHPDDKVVQLYKQKSEEVLAGGPAPKTIVIQPPKP